MINKNIVKQPKSIIEVTITAPWVDVEPKWNDTLQKLSQEVELPGFRKGAASLPMVEQNLGSKLQDEVFKVVFPQFLVEALQGESIVPIDYPHYQLVSFVKGQQLVFKATITQRPEVKVGDYKSIVAQKPVEKIITDEDVDKLVVDLFNRWKNRQPQQSATPQENNNNGQATGSLSFNQPVGQSAGLVDAQGNSVNTQTTSTQPDDEFAKAVGALNLIDLKTKIKADLESEAKYNNELDYEEAILQEAEKMTTVEVPDILIEDELSRMLVSLQRRVADMGLLLEDYLKSQGKTLEGIKTEWRDQAEKNVRMELGLSQIANLEKIDITDAELQAEIDKIQDAKLKTQFESQEPRLHLRHSLRQIRTLDFLKGLVKAT